MRSSIKPNIIKCGCLWKQGSRLCEHQLINVSHNKCIRIPKGFCHQRQRAIKIFSINTNVEIESSNSEENIKIHNIEDKIRVRFAPSPTGNLHVGGARTALFNWLLAKNSLEGKFILRIEDTDMSRSTKESEEAVLQDLKWLGIEWDEGPDIGGEYGPYRQSERKDIYMKYVNKLVSENKAYPCFCTDKELEKMRKESDEKKLAPIYRGPWATADDSTVKEMLNQKKPYCYRFRVKQGELVTLKDEIRGDVTWNTDTLGDFVIMRSNGLPVYNFCVAIDDALMKITHVIRAEEHLPNTLRQLLIYRALGFKEPSFGHVSLILAPDKTKLSKRHGATSVGEFKQQGYLPEAMINYLSMLGWNDGTEQEIYTVKELKEKISLERITKSSAVFDKMKLSWINGQHLRALPFDEISKLIGEDCLNKNILKNINSEFFVKAVNLIQESIELIPDASNQLLQLFSYPINETLASEKAIPFLEDDLKSVFEDVLNAYKDKSLLNAIKDGEDGFKIWLKAYGKENKRKGKRLFMPMRIALTGSMAGPDIGKIMNMIISENDEIIDKENFVNFEKRMEILKDWLSKN